MICFNCHLEGHLASECQWENELQPQPDPLALYRRPPWEVAQYDDINPHAEALRQQMGWPRRGDGGRARLKTLRELAAEQVAESRAARAIIG